MLANQLLLNGQTKNTGLALMRHRHEIRRATKLNKGKQRKLNTSGIMLYTAKSNFCTVFMLRIT